MSISKSFFSAPPRELEGVDAEHRDVVLVHEARTELRGSLAAGSVLVAVTAFLAFEFADRAQPLGFALWLGATGLFLIGWLVAWTLFLLTPPSDAAVLRYWIPWAKSGMSLCNIATAFSVWIFMPVAEPDLRALLVVLFAWYLIMQLAASTEATQVHRSAVVLILGSLIAWLLQARPPYFLPLAAFLALFGATLIATRRFIREAAVTARAAQARADEAAGALRRERDAKTHFIRAASHDLQQPLQAAGLFLDRLRAGAPAPQQEPALAGLRRTLTAARGLVGAMLEHLKLEGGAVEPEMTEFPASDLFTRVLLTQGPAAAAAGLKLSVVGGRVRVHADPLLLSRAVENLVVNAIRHAGAQRILIGVRRAAGAATVWVIDDGRGISEAEAARIFAPFEQGERVGAAGGFGLGLSSARSLAELMGGACGVRCGRPGGAAFWISLPPSPQEPPCAA